jgi:hypothetical protein
MLGYKYRINNLLRDAMCSRCSKDVKKECIAQTEPERFESMLICLKNVMEPNDEKYPVKVPKREV